MSWVMGFFEYGIWHTNTPCDINTTFAKHQDCPFPPSAVDCSLVNAVDWPWCLQSSLLWHLPLPHQNVGSLKSSNQPFLFTLPLNFCLWNFTFLWRNNITVICRLAMLLGEKKKKKISWALSHHCEYIPVESQRILKDSIGEWTFEGPLTAHCSWLQVSINEEMDPCLDFKTYSENKVSSTLYGIRLFHGHRSVRGWSKCIYSS